MKILSVITLSLLSALVAASVILFFNNHNEVQKKDTHKNPTAYQRVMETGVLRCGYAHYPPAFHKDTVTGELSGIMYEITEKMARKLNWQVDWVFETSLADFAEDLKTKKFDALCSAAWPVSARAHHVRFARPLWYSAVGAWTRQDDLRFNQDNLAQINHSDVKISAIDGTMPFHLAQDLFPKASVLSLPALSDYTFNLLNVENGKADVTFVEIYQGHAYLAHNPNTIKNITSDQPIIVYPNSFSVAMGENDLLDTMNMALDELVNSGVVDEIVSAHEKYPNSFRRVAKPYQ